MNKCDTCKYAEWDWSEIKMIEIVTDCSLGFRKKFESEDDCGRFSSNCGAKMVEPQESEDNMNDYERKDNRVFNILTDNHIGQPH